ncbi:MAG TPA: hypothetical protein VHS54_12275 [Jatrophihabitans sp.]|jgi:hypothetical protein|nr:hypothetical protein [Jatrophihabitans sp.]
MSDQGHGTSGSGGPADPTRQPDFGGQPAFGQPDFGGQPAFGGDPNYSPPAPPAGQPPQYPQQPQYVPPSPTQQLPPLGHEPPPYGQPYLGQLPQYPQQPAYGQPHYGAQPQYGHQPPYGPGGGHPAGTGGGGHKTQWIAVLVAILAAAGVGAYFLFSGSSARASSPKEALTKLFEAGKTGDVAAAKKVLCAADVRAGLVDQLRAGGTVTAYTIGKVTHLDSAHATVSATVTTTLTKAPFPQTVPVVKEGGQWKVCYPASGVASPPPATSSPSVPSPPTEGPPGIPSITGLPSLPAGAVNPCQYASDASAAATIYIGLAELGQDATAQACVYQNRVPASVTASLHASGTSLYAPNGSSTGPTFRFTSVDGKSQVEVTVTKESDGKYWVTKVAKS